MGCNSKNEYISNWPHQSCYSGDRTKITNNLTGRGIKEWTTGIGRPSENQKEKENNAKLWLWLLCFSFLKIHTTQNENNVRLFRLINYNSCHQIRKPLRGFQNCSEHRKQFPLSMANVIVRIKVYEQKAPQHDYYKASYILHRHREQRPYLYRLHLYSQNQAHGKHSKS